MSVRCPACKSFNVKKDDRWSNAGMTAGAVGLSPQKMIL